MSKLQEKNLVAQSNKLIEGRFKASKHEISLLVSMISLIEPDDKNFLTFSVTVNDLSKILNLNSRSALREFKKISRRLSSKFVEIETQKGWRIFPWLSLCELDGNNVTVRFNDRLKPYLLDLKRSGNFTQYRLKMATNFSSNYTIRIYQLLREYYSKKIYEFEFLLEDFKKMMLGDNHGKYHIFKRFRSAVINIAKRELGEINKELSTETVTVYKSDLNFKLETRRTGRKISHLKFIIITQNTTAPAKPRIIKKKNEETRIEEVPQIIQAYEVHGVMRSTVQPYLDERDEQALINTLERFKQDKEDGKIKKNMSGYLVSLLKANAGQETEAEREEEKKKEEKKQKAQELKKQKLIKEKREEFKKKFSLKERENYINSMTDEEQKMLKIKILDEVRAVNPFFVSMLRNQPLITPSMGQYITPLIPQFEEKQKEYVTKKLKELGLN